MSQKKQLLFNDDARKAMANGIKQLARVVKVTLGPKGRNVVINKGGFTPPLSTKDGVTVANEVVLKDKFENMGAQLVKQVASKTAEIAGDGTTTAIVLAEAIYIAGMKNVIAGADPMNLKRGMDAAVEVIVKELDKLATPIQSTAEIKQIATISANNDQEIGTFISQAMEKVGKDGIITVEEAKSIETSVDCVEGMQFDKGYLSPYFITNAEKMTCEFANAAVLVTDKKLSTTKDIVPILEKVFAGGARPLLIIAEDIDGEALATLVVNKLKAGMLVCAVKAPGFGDKKKESLQDIAILTGAQLVSEEIGLHLDQVDLDVLGSARTVKISKDSTTIIDGAGDQRAVEERLAQIRAAIKDSNTSNYDREKLEERLAKLAGGVAVIRIGAATETELKEKKARVEDALHATRAAVAEGIVPGGGVALLRAIKKLDSLKLSDEESIGVDIIRRAPFTLVATLIKNCGGQGDLEAQKIFEAQGSYGYNGLTGQFGDMLKEGVVDAKKVVTTALTHAASIAGMLLTTEAAITDKPQPKSKQQPGMDGMGGMGGMGMGGMGGMGMDMM